LVAKSLLDKSETGVEDEDSGKLLSTLGDKWDHGERGASMPETEQESVTTPVFRLAADVMRSSNHTDEKST
jgi:hypothetical protein